MDATMQTLMLKGASLLSVILGFATPLIKDKVNINAWGGYWLEIYWTHLLCWPPAGIRQFS